MSFSQLGACHLLFACVDVLVASSLPPFSLPHIYFFTLYHHQSTLFLPPSLPHPIFEHQGARRRRSIDYLTYSFQFKKKKKKTYPFLTK